MLAGERKDSQLRRHGPFPAGLLGMIALVLAVEAFVAARGDGLATYAALGARFARRAAGDAAAGARVLALGDSVMKFGFDPAAFDSATRSSSNGAYNLAVPGTPPMLGEALLRRALAAGARPRVVLVGYMTLSGDPKVHLNDFAEVFGPLDALRLARDARDPSLFLDVMARRVLPTLRYRGALRAGALAALRGEPTAPGGSFAPGVPGPSAAAERLRLWTEQRGNERQQADGRFDGRMEPDLERRLYSAPWRVHPVLARSFQRLCALAHDHGAAVCVVVTPVAPEAQARRDALNLDAPHTRNLRAIVAKTRASAVLDARRSGYPADSFVDSCHLNAQGAARLSRDLAEALATADFPPSPTGPAWIELPYPRLALDPARLHEVH